MLRNRKRWLLLGLLLLPVAAYLLLPWWLPRGFIKNRIASELSAQTGLSSTIGGLSLSWKDGFELTGVEILNGQDFGRAPFLRIASVHGDFAPWNLLRGRIGELHVRGLDVFLVVNETGRLNCEQITLRPSGQDTQIGRITLADTRLRVKSLSAGDEVVFNFPDAHFQKNSASALGWSVWGSQQDRPQTVIASRGYIGDPGPGRNPDRTGPSPGGDILIQNLLLDQLPAGLTQRLLPLIQRIDPAIRTTQGLQGDLNLSARLTLGDDGQIELAGQTSLQRLTVAGADDAGAVMPLLQQAQFAGEWHIRGDFIGGDLELAHLDLNLPGVILQLEGGYHPRPGDTRGLALIIKNGVLDARRLLDALPILRRVEVVRQSALRTEGQIQLSGSYTANDRQEELLLQIDGRDWILSAGELHKRRGDPMLLKLQSSFNRMTGELTISPLELRWLGLEAAAEVLLPNRYAIPVLDQPWDYPRHVGAVVAALIAQRRELGVQAVITISDMAQLQLLREWWDKNLPGLEIKGPLRAELRTGTEQRDKSFRCLFNLPPESTVTWAAGLDPAPPLFAKQAGLGLNLEFTGTIASRAAALENTQLKLNYGPAQLQLGPGRLSWNEPTPTGQWQLQGPWRVERIEDLLGALPSVAQQVSAAKINLAGVVSGEISLRNLAGAYVTQATLNARDLDFYLGDRNVLPAAGAPPHLHKPAGVSCTAQVKGDFNPADGLLRGSLDFDLPDAVNHLQLTGKRQAGGGAYNAWFLLDEVQWQAEFPEISRVPNYFPLWREKNRAHLGEFILEDFAGPLKLRATVRRNDGWDTQFELDDSGGRFHLLGQNAGAVFCRKQTDIPLRLFGEISLRRQNDFLGLLFGGADKRPVVVDIRRLTAEFDTSYFSLTGSVVTGPEIPTDVAQAMQTIQNSTLDWQGRLGHAGRWPGQFPVLALRLRAAGVELAGSTLVQGRLRWNRLDRELRNQVDFTDTRVKVQPGKVGWLEKPAGVALACNLDLHEKPREKKIVLESLAFTAGANRLSIDGNLDQLSLADLLLEPNLARPSGSARIVIDASRLEEPLAWLPPLRPLRPRGQLHLRLPVEWSRSGWPTVPAGELGLSLEGVLQDQPFAIRVRDAEFSSRHLLLPELALRLGGNDLTLAADIHSLNWAGEALYYEGRSEAISGKIDMDEIVRLCGLGSLEQDELSLPKLERLINRVRPFLAGDLAGGANLGQLSLTDNRTGGKLNLQELRGRYRLGQQKFELSLLGSINGGTIDLGTSADLTKHDPAVTYTLNNRNLQADEAIAPIVESEFPGMAVRGKISEQKQMQSSLSVLLGGGGWIGTGATVATSGMIYGPGGPGWLLRVFPGLELVKYPWKEMTNRYETQADGSKKNHMLFSGETYDIYIDGTSRLVKDEALYQKVVQMLHKDLDDTETKLAAVEAGEEKPEADVFRLLRRQRQDLVQLARRAAAGERLEVHEADYVVGALISGSKKKDPFAQQREFLRAPIFRSHSYIIGRQMIGNETTNVGLSEIGRENPIYRLIQGK